MGVSNTLLKRVLYSFLDSLTREANDWCPIHLYILPVALLTSVEMNCGSDVRNVCQQSLHFSVSVVCPSLCRS